MAYCAGGECMLMGKGQKGTGKFAVFKEDGGMKEEN